MHNYVVYNPSTQLYVKSAHAFTTTLSDAQQFRALDRAETRCGEAIRNTPIGCQPEDEDWIVERVFLTKNGTDDCANVSVAEKALRAKANSMVPRRNRPTYSTLGGTYYLDELFPDEVVRLTDEQLNQLLVSFRCSPELLNAVIIEQDRRRES